MDLLSQHEAFLRAIFDTPEDDTARLVYADFLQEHGEEDRAELIRVQCEFATKAGQIEHRDRVWELSTRERELFDRLRPPRAEWDDPESMDYVRGFRSTRVAFVVTKATLADPIAERWRIVRSEPETFGARNLEVEHGLLIRPEHIELLFTLPTVPRIGEWLLNGSVHEALSHSGPGAFDLIDLTKEPVITTAGVEVLARHRGARRITSLDLRNNDLDNDAARAIVRSPYFDNLKQLKLLDGNRLRGKVWQQVIGRFGEDVVG